MPNQRAGAVAGFTAGAAVALGFALIISVLPAWVFLEAPWRVVVYLACAAAAPPTVLFTNWIAGRTAAEPSGVFVWAMAGAMTFDGLAIGFVPALYGQTDQALAWAASALLFAFASNLVASRFMVPGDAALRPG